MIRKLFTRAVLRHDARPDRLPGERGIDYLRRCMAKSSRTSARRLRRIQGRRPWRGLGWAWRWLYAPYHAELERRDALYLAGLDLNAYVREMSFREGFRRKIMPPGLTPDRLLDRTVPSPRCPTGVPKSFLDAEL